MAWQQTMASAQYSSGRLSHAGGGDPDVFSQGGRTTLVELKTSNVRPSDDWRNILVDVSYSVKEGRHNDTLLTWNGIAALPVPVDAHRHSVRIGDTRNYSGSWHVRGKVHDWIQLTNTANTVIESGSYRIDGPGNDQQNAGIQLNLAVPVLYSDSV
jgi:hypothetical protein